MNEEGRPEVASTPPRVSAAAVVAVVTSKGTPANSKRQQQHQPARRSARVLEHDPILAPGFGTQKDIQRLSAQLNSSVSHFPPEAVIEMMSARGRGLRSARGGVPDDEEKTDGADPSSSLWADFMMEEGVLGSTSAATRANEDSARSTAGKRGASAAAKSGAAGKVAAALKSSKRSKTSPVAGVLVQTGTLDSAVVGRGQGKNKGETAASLSLLVPTIILPSVKISRVFTSCNAVHSIAVDTNGVPYGWGRNDAGQLGSHLPSNVVLPTRFLEGSEGPVASAEVTVYSAALGKGHTLLLTPDGHIWAVGSNKSGQCGIQKAGDSVPNFRQCTLPVGVMISQVRWEILSRASPHFAER
jgi:hypothetical protein